MASRSEKLRRRQHRKDKKRRSGGVIYQSTPETSSRGDLLVIDAPGQVMMSEVLIELIRPEWGACQDEGAMRRLLTMGMMAWNGALEKGAARTAFVEKMAQAFPDEIREDATVCIEDLIERKERLFPDVQRPIFDYQLTFSAGNAHVNVLSGLG